MTALVSLGDSRATLQTYFNGYSSTYCESRISTGIGYTQGNSFADKFNLSESDILTVTYYDSYWYPGVKTFNTSVNISDYSDGTGNSYYFDDVKGQVTGTRTKVLDGSSVRWLVSTNYYDNKYRVIQGLRDLYATDATYSEVVSSLYDFTGRVLQTKINQSFGSTSTTVNKYFAYDSQGRLTNTDQEIAGDVNGRVTVAENVYNETGQLVTKKLHKAYPYDYLQNVDYTYNIRGWLASINNPDNLSSDLFAERLLYESSESGLNSSYPLQYNGNISGMVWNSTQKSKQGYGFSYDGLNRLNQGYHKYYPGYWLGDSKYDEKEINYDRNGNITALQRTDQNGNTSDNFTYNYSGNQLSNINSGISYAYDPNGNTTTDGLRGMSIEYNVLNLPNSITKGSESISYIYSASGEKLAKRMKDYSYQYYAGNMVYNNDKSLKFILFEEGLVNKSSGAFTYEYHLKDHLGNTRVAFQPNGGSTTITQVAEYYPFGSSYLPFNPAGSNKYLYNGKEKQDDVLAGTALDEYDYEARYYDPVIGRFNMLDPMTEKYHGLSPYAYCADNPMRYIDPTGMEFTDDAWKWVNELIAQVNSRQESNNAKIADKKAKLDAKGLSARQEKTLNRQIGRLENENARLEGVRGEVATLAASDQVYNVVESSSQNEPGTEIAYTSFNNSTKNVDITISSGAGLGLFAHELLHSYQFERGQISLGDISNSTAPGFLLDKTDELAGFTRQGLFGSNQGVTSINSLPERYKGLPTGPTDINNFSFQGRKLADMNQYELQRLSKIMKQAFRYNGKTIY